MTDKKPLLEIKNLSVKIEDKEIIKNLDFTVNAGEIHAIMGPNGSGKSTLCYALTGHPEYEITGGEVIYEGRNLLEMEVDQRAQAGVFLAFQYPVEVPGVTLQNFLRTAYNARHGNGGNGQSNKVNVLKFWGYLKEKLKMLEIPESFANRYLNEGFSGGEKKRAEILQMAVLEPKVALLDETDSGLDIDALRAVADGINKLMHENMAVVMITHYQRLLNYIKPHFVHIMSDGNIIKTGGPELALQLEDEGYGWITGDKAKSEAQ